MIDFITFSSHCKYQHGGFNIDREYEITCRKEDCIPSGHSWGICDEAHCPAFKKQTRLDIIKAKINDMNAEELVRYMDSDPFCNCDKDEGCTKITPDCIECEAEYLNQEVNDDNSLS